MREGMKTREGGRRSQGEISQRRSYPIYRPFSFSNGRRSEGRGGGVNPERRDTKALEDE
jgi:hypothetical protein